MLHCAVLSLTPRTHARTHAPLQVEARQRTSSDASSSIVAGRCCGESDRGSTCCARADCLRMRRSRPVTPSVPLPLHHSMHGPAHARPARTLAHWHTGSREASVGRAAVCRPLLHAACRTLPPSRMARRVCACLGASIWACWHSASGAVHGGDHDSASQWRRTLGGWIASRGDADSTSRLGGAADSASSVPLTTPRTIFPRTSPRTS